MQLQHIKMGSYKPMNQQPSFIQCLANLVHKSVCTHELFTINQMSSLFSIPTSHQDLKVYIDYCAFPVDGVSFHLKQAVSKMQTGAGFGNSGDLFSSASTQSVYHQISQQTHDSWSFLAPR